MANAKNKAKTADDLRALSSDELKKALNASRREILNLRFQSATGQSQGMAQLAVLRKTIARILTVCAEKQSFRHLNKVVV